MENASLTDRLEELLPIVERVQIPEASRLMHEENAVATNEVILEFLGRHRGGGRSPSFGAVWVPDAVFSAVVCRSLPLLAGRGSATY